MVAWTTERAHLSAIGLSLICFVCHNFVFLNFRSYRFPSLPGFGDCDHQRFVICGVARHGSFLAFHQELYMFGCSNAILPPQRIACWANSMGYGRQIGFFLFHGREKRMGRLSGGERSPVYQDGNDAEPRTLQKLTAGEADVFEHAVSR